MDQREIKFRQPVEDTAGNFIEFHYWGFINGAFIGPVGPFSAYETGTGCSQQFTGLLDKNRKEIYDGDIIKSCDDSRNGIKFHWVVEWGHHAWTIRHIESKKKSTIVSNYFFRQSEVIGHIYEKQ